MISDMTLGQFFPGFSPLHRLDPRTKILIATLFIVGVFLANNTAAFILLTLITVFMIAVSRISFSVVLKGIKPIVFILIFTSLLNIFMTAGSGDPLNPVYLAAALVGDLARTGEVSYRRTASLDENMQLH